MLTYKYRQIQSSRTTSSVIIDYLNSSVNFSKRESINKINTKETDNHHIFKKKDDSSINFLQVTKPVLLTCHSCLPLEKLMPSASHRVRFANCLPFMFFSRNVSGFFPDIRAKRVYTHTYMSCVTGCICMRGKCNLGNFFESTNSFAHVLHRSLFLIHLE